MSAITLNHDTVDQFREPAFVVLLMVGTIILSIGFAFLIIGIAINTEPPAPYVSQMDKYLLIAISITAVAGGSLLIRLAGRVVGW